HVSVWVKGEKIRNSLTGEFENPDERLMREVEGLLGVKAKHDDLRRGLISAIAAWAIDHPGQRIVNSVVFPQQMRRLRDAVFTERRKGVAKLTRDLVGVLRSRETKHAEWGDLHEEEKRSALAALERLKREGYCDACALDAASALLRLRFHELVVG